MQFKAIIVLALAAAVSAVPAGDLDARTGSSCGSGLALSCCQQLQKIPSFLGITIPIQLGVGCTLNGEYPGAVKADVLYAEHVCSSQRRMQPASRLLSNQLI